MSQMPPVNPPHLGYSDNAYLPAKRTNGLAIASLVCGIILCVPFITSFAAILLGIFGLRKTRDPNVGGKALAIVGLVLGIVGVAGWGLLGGVLGTAYVVSGPARTVADQFAMDVAKGNISAAVTASAGMTPEELTAVSDKLKPWGTLTGVTFFGFNTQSNLNGATTCELVGVAIFTTGGQKTYTATLVKQGGVFKVQKFNFQ